MRRTPPASMAKSAQRQGVRVRAGSHADYEQAAKSAADSMAKKMDADKVRLDKELAPQPRRQ